MSFYGVVTQCLERIEALEKKLQELEDFNTPAEQKLELLRNQIDRVDKRLEDLETKTASDLSQLVVAESATGEEQDCLWVARDEGGLFAFSQEPEFFRGEWSSDGDYYKLPDNLLPQITFENSPQKLVLESSISKMETVEKDVLDKLKSLLSRIDKDYEENLEYSHYEEGQQDLIKEIREVIE
jgi:hypothetical protein